MTREDSRLKWAALTVWSLACSLIEAAGPPPEFPPPLAPDREWAFARKGHYPVPALERVVFVSPTRVALTITWCFSSRPCEVFVWDIVAGKKAWSAPMDDARVPGLAVSPDGRLLATGSRRGRLHLWDASSGKKLMCLAKGQTTLPAEDAVYAACFSPDSRLVAFGNHERSAVYSTRTGRLLAVFPCKPSGIRPLGFPWISAPNLAFTPDGRALVAGDLHEVKLIETASMKVRSRFTVTHNPNSNHTSVTALPQGRFVLTCADHWPGGLSVWDTRLGLRVDNSGYAPTHTSSLAVDPKGRIVVAAGACCAAAHVLDLATGLPVATLPHVSEHGCGVAISPDGKWVASCGMDGALKIWDMKGVLRRLPTTSQGPRAQPLPRRHFSRAALARFWDDLAGDDAARAYRAINSLASSPEQAVRLIRRRLPPRVAVPEERIHRLLERLQSEKFTEREEAWGRLVALEGQASPLLQKAAEGGPDLELRLRAKKALAQIELPLPAGPLLQGLRAVEVLELAGTPKTRRLLWALSRGAGRSAITAAARQGLARLGATSP